MKRKPMGRGLGALLPDPEPSSEVPIDSLEPNPLQPRLHFASEALDQLAQSIRESGMVQPILVRQRPAGRYQIIAGERRWRAAQLLALATVPVVVREVPDDRLLEMALIENIQREELTPIETAHACQKLLESLRITKEELARRLGKTRPTVANTIRLLQLPAPVQAFLNDRRLSEGHARPLLALNRAEDQVRFARETVQKGLNVRQVEKRVAEHVASSWPQARTENRKDPNTRAAEERLRASLGTRVEIRRRGRGGVVEIAFSNEPELNRLFEWLVHARRA